MKLIDVVLSLVGLCILAVLSVIILTHMLAYCAYNRLTIGRYWK